jgi:hypothetical protein
MLAAGEESYAVVAALIRHEKFAEVKAQDEIGTEITCIFKIHTQNDPPIQASTRRKLKFHSNFEAFRKLNDSLPGQSLLRKL